MIRRLWCLYLFIILWYCFNFLVQVTQVLLKWGSGEKHFWIWSCIWNWTFYSPKFKLRIRVIFMKDHLYVLQLWMSRYLPVDCDEFICFVVIENFRLIVWFVLVHLKSWDFVNSGTPWLFWKCSFSKLCLHSKYWSLEYEIKPEMVEGVITGISILCMGSNYLFLIEIITRSISQVFYGIKQIRKKFRGFVNWKLNTYGFLL